MDLKKFQEDVHRNAAEHGWWEPQEKTVIYGGKGDGVTHSEGKALVPRTFGDLIALCHSELSEALEAFRVHGIDRYTHDESVDPTNKPEGAFVELADCIIRILDMASAYGVDMESILQEKHEYNKTRPFRHGGKKL